MHNLTRDIGGGIGVLCAQPYRGHRRGHGGWGHRRGHRGTFAELTYQLLPLAASHLVGNNR